MALNARYIRRKIPYMSKNVKQYLISCPTLVLRYISLNILSQKTFTLRNCCSPHVRLWGDQSKNKDSGCCQGGKIQGVKGSCLSMDNLKKMIKIDFDKIKHL